MPFASTCPTPRRILQKIAEAYGTRTFEKIFAKFYPKCENISVDYAILEPRSAKGERASNLFCIPANYGWNDLGSWAALLRASRGPCYETATSFTRTQVSR